MSTEPIEIVLGNGDKKTCLPMEMLMVAAFSADNGKDGVNLMMSSSHRPLGFITQHTIEEAGQIVMLLNNAIADVRRMRKGKQPGPAPHINGQS